MKARDFTTLFLREDVSKALEWIHLAWENQVIMPEKFSWYSLAYGILSKIKANINSQGSDEIMAWSEVVNEIYSNLQKENKLDSELIDLQYELMSLRTLLILKFGVVQNHPLLDKDILITWFFSNLEFSIEIARRKSQIWQRAKRENQELTFNEVKELRKVKNMVTLMKRLSQKNVIENQALDDWISIQQELP